MNRVDGITGDKYPGMWPDKPLPTVDNCSEVERRMDYTAGWDDCWLTMQEYRRFWRRFRRLLLPPAWFTLVYGLGVATIPAVWLVCKWWESL